MSLRAGSLGSPPVAVGPAHRRSSSGAGAGAAARAERPGVRLAAFAALVAYGLERWATLLRPAPGWRLFGLLALAIALAGPVAAVARRSRVAAGAAAVVIGLLAFPVAGLRWHWLIHLRVTATADRIGTGLGQLPSVLVPYLGHDPDVRFVIVLGAAVLVLDAAAVLAFAGRSFGDGCRMAALLPLTALAVVPSTLVRPHAPFVQGLILFGLMAAFAWGDRVRRASGAAGLLAVLVAGVAAAIVAPHLADRRPWVDYRTWAGAPARRVLDSFAWNQTYGPLRWPRAGREVLSVQAATPDYWKAEDLDTFNGYQWVQSPVSTGLRARQPLPRPSPAALTRWSHTIEVAIEGMRTQDVIAAGDAQPPVGLPGLAPGADAGTWVTGQSLGPGIAYRVRTYSPRPTGRELAAVRARYPAAAGSFLTIDLPGQHGQTAALIPVRFPAFGSPPDRAVARIMRASPYAGAWALSRRLAAGAGTPYGYVQRVLRYLSGSHGFTYNEDPPQATYPLESFLLRSRQGYCQQFSGAMALLLRMGGVPARVASGFTPGTRDGTSHRWIVTDTDAHAWVEVWFPGYGWVLRDPTPASAPARAGEAPAALPSGFSAAAAPKTPTPRVGASSPQVTAPAVRHRPGGGVGPWLIGAAVVLAGVLALVGWAVRPATVSVSDLVDELERALARTRRPLADDMTLAGLEHRLASSPEAAGYVRTLRLHRYGGAPGLPTSAQRRAVRRELARGLGLAGRLRALWALPPRRTRESGGGWS